MSDVERISAREFARRADVHERQVRRALARGLLHRDADGLLDARLLATHWHSPNARTRERGPSRETTGELPAVLLEKERSLAALRRLEYERKSGTLVEFDVAKGVLFQAAREARDAWIAWPTRISPSLAARLGIEVDLLLLELTRAVHEQLGRMGDPSGDFGSHKR